MDERERAAEWRRRRAQRWKYIPELAAEPQVAREPDAHALLMYEQLAEAQPGHVREALPLVDLGNTALVASMYTPAEADEVEAFARETGSWDIRNFVNDDNPDALCNAWPRWRDGRKELIVAVARDYDRYRRLLHDRFGPRVVVVQATYSVRELHALMMRVVADRDELARLGIELNSCGPNRDSFEVCYYARDPALSASLLRSRYGSSVNLFWLGESSTCRRSCPFGSWTANGLELTVFYALHRREQPVGCSVEEHEDRVVVNVEIIGTTGTRKPFPKELLFSYERHHAVAALTQEVGDRRVIDAATGHERPRWVENDQGRGQR